MRSCTVVLILFFFSLSINAQNLLERKVDFKIEKSNAAEALKKLSAETNIDFSFSSNFFNQRQELTLDFRQKTIDEILGNILNDYPLAYKAQNNRILIYKFRPKTYTISGYLEDASSGERLIAATVFCLEHSQGTTSNEYGFFSLTLPEGKATINISYLGYTPTTSNFTLDKNIQTKIGLKTGYDLPEVIVKPEQEQSQRQVEEHSAYILDRDKTELIPGIGGEVDLMRNAQLLPGIQTPVDGLGGLIIRGGGTGQNLLLLDGVPVYIPYHLLGLYSIYNNRTVNSAKVLKGSFPARYGGRLSSVFDVRTREGNQYSYNAEAGINLTSSNLLLEGPWKKGKGAFLFAGRQSHSSFLLEPSLSNLYFQTDEGSLETEFFDFNIKFNYTISAKDRLFLSLFSGGDEFSKKFFDDSEEEFSEESEYELYWRNSIGSLRWNHLFTDKLFLNTTLTYSFFDYEQTFFNSFTSADPEEGDILEFFDSRSENRDLGIKFDFNWLPSAAHNLRFGVAVSNKFFIPEVTYFDEDDIELDELDEIDINALQTLITEETHPVTDISLYMEDDFKISKKLHTNIGLRSTTFITEERNYISLEPRISLHFHPNDYLHLKVSTGQMKQFLHLISNTALSLPNDLWTPASEDILPQQAWQSELGFIYDSKQNFHFELEGFYKKMENLYAYPDNADFLTQLNDDDIERFLTKGSGTAYGIESLIAYDGPSFGTKIGLTYSKIKRQYAKQNLGREYPFEYDYPIQANIFIYKKLGKYFQASLHWTYQSANPQFEFEVQQQSSVDPTRINPLGQKNLARGILFHRLDVQFSYQQSFARFAHKFSIGANNIYNRDNAAYFLVEDFNEVQPVSALPILPSLSYSIQFKNFSKKN